MAEKPVTGSEFKKFVKLAKRQDVSFAFNPGKNGKEHYMLLHRLKSASLLGKDAKKDGPGSKAGFGKMRVDAKFLEMQVETAVPSMAKRLKELLRLHKVPLNVRILDSEGGLLEEEVEDLPDDPEFDDDMAEELPEDPTQADPAQPQDEDTGDEEDTWGDPTPEIDPTTLVAGLKALQPQIETAPVGVQEKLKKALAATAKLIKAGKLEDAQTALESLEVAVAKLPTAKDAPAEAEPQVAAPENTEDLKLRIKSTQAMIAQAPAAAQDKLLKALTMAAQGFKANDFSRVETVLGQIDGALTKLGVTGASGQEAANPPEAPPETTEAEPKTNALREQIAKTRSKARGQVAGDALQGIETVLDQALEALENGDESKAAPAIAWSNEAIRLQQAVDALMPDFNRAASSGAVADPQALRAAFQMATELVTGQDHSKGWTALGKAEEMIMAGLRDNAQAFLAEVPEGVRDFAVARLNWVSAHKSLYAELDKLQKAIEDTCKDDPDLQHVVSGAGTMRSQLDDIDLRLAKSLDAIVNAADEGERAKMKGDARSVLAEYQSVLLQPFFRDVDKNNGFTEVSVSATASRVLDDIDRVLAA